MPCTIDEINDTTAKAIALAIVTRAFRDLRYKDRRDEAEGWLCSEDGRTWLELAGLDYGFIMMQAERVMDLPPIDKRKKRREACQSVKGKSYIANVKGNYLETG